jgi:DNA-directed RNA polymerase specialized sigma24 family protein
MSRLHGMQNKEIAQTLGISEKAVEKNMTKALKVLRARLKSQEEKLPSPEILSLLLPIIFV